MSDQHKPSRADAAFAELQAIIELLTKRCCQHAADSNDLARERDAALKENEKLGAAIVDVPSVADGLTKDVA
jgi:hypothetical protein